MSMSGNGDRASVIRWKPLVSVALSQSFTLLWVKFLCYFSSQFVDRLVGQNSSGKIGDV
ncbi:hypothetical protein POG22_23800 [Geitlerinema sp. CS-897]|nr:hypothetical protein [Geitlerinema sp. CS-897]